MSHNAKTLHTKGLLLSITLLLATQISALSQSDVVTPIEKNRKEAEQLWERMVEARGGRKALHAITNVLKIRGNDPDDMEVELSVYPNKHWVWKKDKKFDNFMYVGMENLDIPIVLLAEGWIMPDIDKNMDPNRVAYHRELWLFNACEFFLETKWARPTAISVRRERLGKELVDVIETNFPELPSRKYGLRYYVEPETLEVRRVASTDDTGKELLSTWFDRWGTVDGIKVPGAFDVTDRYDKPPKKSSYMPVSFQFNVDYNEKVFLEKPTVAAGPDAWKARR